MSFEILFPLKVFKNTFLPVFTLVGTGHPIYPEVPKDMPPFSAQVQDLDLVLGYKHSISSHCGSPVAWLLISTCLGTVR